MVNRQIESDWWRMAVDGGLCPNLGARQVKASHRHFMGSGSTGSKSKVLGLCWRTGWLSEGDVFGGGVAGPGGVVQGRSAVGDRSASNQKHEPQPQLSVLLVLGSSCRRNITSPIDQSQSVIQSFSHLVTQSFDQSSSEYVMVIIISAKRRTRARLVSILFKPKVGRSTQRTKNSKPLVPEGGHWVETRGKALPFSRNQSAFRWNPQVLPVDLWILISETWSHRQPLGFCSPID